MTPERLQAAREEADRIIKRVRRIQFAMMLGLTALVIGYLAFKDRALLWGLGFNGTLFLAGLPKYYMLEKGYAELVKDYQELKDMIG